MTKKDFQLIAQAILKLPWTRVTPGLCAYRTEIAEHFADALAPTNPRFKRDLFIQAATGVVAVTARKARPNLLTVDDAATTIHAITLLRSQSARDALASAIDYAGDREDDATQSELCALVEAGEALHNAVSVPRTLASDIAEDR